MSEFSRREMLRALALGGAVVAGELWIPGQTLISIPNDGIALWSIPHPALEATEHWKDMVYAQYLDQFVACYEEGGAMKSVVSDDGITWQHIKPAELYVDA